MESSFMIRPLKMKDTLRMLEWMRNDDVTQHLNIGGSHTNPNMVEEFIRNAKDESTNIHRAIVDMSDTYCGTISLKNIDHERLEAEYAIVMHMDAIGTGASADATDLICCYAFEELGLKRVILCVRKENQRAIGFYRKKGFISIPCPGYEPYTDSRLIWYERRV